MNKNIRKLNYLLSFFIPLVVVALSYIICNLAPFGDNNIFLSDTTHEYLPYLQELYDRIKGGDSLIYSLNEGLGYNFTTIWTYYLSDPTNLIVLLFPKASMFSVLNVLYMLKIALAGLAASIYFVDLEKSKVNTTLNLKPILFSASYALSGFMIGQGLNVTCLTSVALFPLVMLGLKRLISNQKCTLYIIFTTLTLLCNMYIGMIISIFTIFYLLLQKFDNIRHFAKSICLFIISNVLSIGCSMVVISPSIKGTVFKDTFSIIFPYRGFLANMFDSIKMLFAGSLPSSASNYVYGINIYSGVLILFLLICYIFNKNIGLSTKLRNLSLVAILFISTFVVTANYLFNAFHSFDNATSNFGFILIFILITIAYDSFGKINKLSTLQLSLSTLVSIGLIIASMIFATNYDSVSPFITTMELIILYFVIILFYKKENISKLAFRIAMVIISVAELSFVFFNTTKTLSETSISYSDSEAYKLSIVKDDILSKDKGARILVYESGSTSTTPLINMISGYDYIITLADDSNVDSMLEYSYSQLGYDIYTNPYAINLGVLANDYIKTWNYNESFPYKALNSLSENGFSGYDGGTLFNPILGDLGFNMKKQDENDTAKTGEYNFYITSPEDSDLYMNFYDIVHIGKVAKGETIEYIYDFTAEQLRNFRMTIAYTNFDSDEFINLYNSITTFEDDLIIDEGYYEGTITADASSTLLTNIPYEEGWIATVDGKEVETFSVSDTYLAIDITKGTHVVTFEFKSLHLTKGLLISIIFILMTIFLLSPISLPIRKKLYQYISKSKVPNSILNSIASNQVYYYYFIITTLAFVLIMMIKGCVPFGYSMPMGNDAYAQSLPYIGNIMSQFRHMSFGTVNWSMGLGVDNILVLLSGGAFPLNFLMLLFPESMLIEAFVFIYYVKLIFIGFAIIYYLSHRTIGKSVSKDNKMLIVFALAYTFNAFVITYFNNITFLDMALMIPLVILGLDYLITKKNIKLYVVTLSIVMFFNVYYAFLLCMFLFLYFFTLKFDNIKDFFKKAMRFGLSSILSAGIAAASLIPFYMATLVSPYKAGDTSPSFAFDFNILHEIERLMPISPAKMISYDYWESNIYCGLLTIIFIALFALNKKIDLSIRIRKMALVVILFLAFGNEFMNFVFHGFHVQTGVPNRFAIFWIFLLLTMLFDTILDLDSYSKKTMLITASTTAVIFLPIWIIQNDSLYDTIKLIYALVFIIAYLVGIILYAISKIDITKLKKHLLVTLAIEIIIAGTINFDYIGSVTFEHEQKEMSTINEVSDILGLDDNLNYTEYVGTAMADIGLILDINQVSIFSSSMTHYSESLTTHLGVSSASNYIKYHTGNPLSNLLFSVKYNIVNSYLSESISTFEPIYEYDNLTIARNKYHIPHGIFMNVPREDLVLADDTETIFKYHNEVSSRLSDGFKIYDTYDLEYLAEEDLDNSGMSNYYTLSTDMVYLLENDYVSDEASIEVILHINPKADGPYYFSSAGKITYLGDAIANTDNTFSLVYTKDAFNKLTDGNYISTAVLNLDAYEELYNALSEHTLTNLEYDNSSLSGTIDAPTDGYVYMGITYNDGWKAFVDGVETDIVLLMDGGICVPVTKGTHNIKITYMSKGFIPACLISLSFILIFAGYCIIASKQSKKQKTEITENK